MVIYSDCFLHFIFNNSASKVSFKICTMAIYNEHKFAYLDRLVQYQVIYRYVVLTRRRDGGIDLIEVFLQINQPPLLGWSCNQKKTTVVSSTCVFVCLLKNLRQFSVLVGYVELLLENFSKNFKWKNCFLKNLIIRRPKLCSMFRYVF